MSGLDDLLGYEEDESHQQRRASSNIAVVLPTIGVLSVLIWWVLGRMTVGTPYLLVLGSMLAIYLLRVVLGTIHAPRLPVTLRNTPPRSASAGTNDDGIRQAARRWDQRLDYAHDDARHMAHLIQPAFADVVDERLRLVHGITRASDPARARELIGPQLWKFITQPVPRQVTPQEIATLVAQMEAL
jgi:hypothetical protein